MDIIEYKYHEGFSELVAISLVRNPAVDVDFLCFSKKDNILHFNDEKMIVTGVAIRANYIIEREGFSIVFRKNEIEKIMIGSMKKGFPSTINHDGKLVNSVYMIESYILREPSYLFPGVDVGSWIVSYKIDDREVWNKIKGRSINGFSIEIPFNKSKSNKHFIL